MSFWPLPRFGAHNFSVTARIRLTGWYESGSYYSPAYRAEFDAFPTIAWTGDLSIEDENWWDQKPLTRDIEGLTRNAIHVLPEPSSIPNWRVEIFDEGNAAGYLDIGRLFAATGWQPSQGVERGPTLRPEDPTNVETTMSGRDVADPRAVFRVWNVAFRMMDRQELLDQGFGLQRKAGVHEEIFFVFDPDDARNLTTTSFFARLRRLQDYELVQSPRANLGFELKELL
ncbi:hypothetical protein [uncultured Aureimonas sp.]|uniref:hypothetical protein n=1 Tax=uncultured Aureimonas sp. TaxID=1604662 RepID=UPI0025E14A83|nr:hypothetical protein [uncultured Aureimonas sp.]